MPKDRLVRQIDLRGTNGVSSSTTFITGLPAYSSPSEKVIETVYRPDTDYGYIARSSVVVRDISVSNEMLYFNDPIWNDESIEGEGLGDRIILNQYNKPDEVVRVLEYIGESAEGFFGYRVVRATYGTSPTAFDAYKCRGYYSQRNIITDKSIRQPAFYMKRDWDLPHETAWGYLVRVDDVLKDQFYPWVDWELYGIVTEAGRFTGEVATKDLEVMNNAAVRNAFTAIPTATNAGMIAGNTPVGPGFVGMDTQGLPWFQAISIYDSIADMRNNRFRIEEGGETIMEYQTTNGNVWFPTFSHHNGAVITASEDAPEGVILPAQEYNPSANGVLLAGYHKDEDEDPVPNAPVHLHGSAIALHAGLFFVTDVTIVSDDHYLILKPSVENDDGKYYSQVIVGPKVEYTTEEDSSSATDYLLVDGQETVIITHTVAALFSAGSTIYYSGHFSEEGGRTANFELRLYNDSSGVGDSYVYVDTLKVSLNSNNQYIFRTREITGGVGIGELLQIRAYVDETHSQAVGYLRGSEDPTTISLSYTG